MVRLELFDFQQEAANKLFETALIYYEDPDRSGGQTIPFVGQLKAVTGAGKTPILAEVVGRLRPSIVLWTTKFGSVVDQTVKNLGIGGKYHHLLGDNPVEVVRFSDLRSAAEWQRILTRDDGVTVLVSTVAAWNSSEKDERLNVHRVAADWGDKSRWDQLKSDRRRPLWVVYDEAHNTTTDQVELLDNLDPAGFFVASASPVKGKLQLYLTNIRDETLRSKRIVPVSTRAVVEAQLLKSTISLADFDSPTEEMLQEVAAKRKSLEDDLSASGEEIIPKAIYVVESSNVAKGTDSRPTAIWKYLVNSCGVCPEHIAVCTNSKDLPKDAIMVQSIDQLSNSLTHIVFNKRLQEGWDDPSVYVCYLDGKTESATRIQQVLGRALRQSGAKHLSNEDLNTAYFYINCPNEALEKITDELMEELRIYKTDDETEEFEPFKIKEEKRKAAKILLKPEWEGKLRVPQLQPELPVADALKKLVEHRTYDFGPTDLAARGKATINVVSVKTGDVSQTSRDLYEDMRVRCGAFLHDQIRALSRNCANSMQPSIFNTRGLSKTACYNSQALDHYRDVAAAVVTEYENRVKLEQLDDPDPEHNEYVVDAYQPDSESKRPFNHAGHPYYDSKSFNSGELEMARALDKYDQFVWVRNKPKVGYDIPLPIKSGSSNAFYPDFLWWVNDSIWAIDPTGKFLVEEKLRTKLLMLPQPLRIALVAPEKLDQNYKKLVEPGWTLLRFRNGNVLPEPFDTIAELVSTLVSES